MTAIWRIPIQPSDPWYLLDCKSKKWAELQALETLTQGIEIALQNARLAVPLLQNTFPLKKLPKLSEIPLNKELTDEKYKEGAGSPAGTAQGAS